MFTLTDVVVKLVELFILSVYLRVNKQKMVEDMVLVLITQILAYLRVIRIPLDSSLQFRSQRYSYLSPTVMLNV